LANLSDMLIAPGIGAQLVDEMRITLALRLLADALVGGMLQVGIGMALVAIAEMTNNSRAQMAYLERMSMKAK